MSIDRSKVSDLDKRELKFLEGVLAGKSQTQAYLDAGYDCTRESAAALASKKMKSDKIQKAMQELQEPKKNFGRAIIAENIYAAIDTILDVMTSDKDVTNSKQKLKAAFGLLDRAGITPVQKSELMGKVDVKKQFTQEEQMQIGEALKRLDEIDREEEEDGLQEM